MFDYDLLIIGCSVGGHGAARHAVGVGLKVAVVRTYFGGNSKAIAQGDTDGMAKLVNDANTKELLGCRIM